MLYNNPFPLLSETQIHDVNGITSINDLPNPTPENPIRLNKTTPLIERLWRIALRDVEANIVRDAHTAYFGAGAEFGKLIYTRDISYAGILGLNRLYPGIMQSSLDYTRQIHLRLGYTVSRAYHIPALAAPWNIQPLTEDQFLAIYHTNNFLRRTDDVVWLWAAHDLASQQADKHDWQRLYDTGQACFERLYDPLFDPTDGLYRGQASFIDIHFENHQATGYPPDWTIADCVLIKATSTNALYYIGLCIMADIARRLQRPADTEKWDTRASQLKTAIRQELRQPNGTFAYYKTASGELSERREALGSALAVLAGIVEGKEAQQALDEYPVTEVGVPLFLPFFPTDTWYHNQSAWPFVDAFFLWALEKATGRDLKPLLCALLARTCNRRGTFFEVTDLRDKQVKGSSQQLWTAAAFLNVCIRANLVKD